MNVRLTAPLPEESPTRPIVTVVSVMTEGKSFVLEVKNADTIETPGCPEGVSVCIAGGGLQPSCRWEGNNLLTCCPNTGRVRHGRHRGFHHKFTHRMSPVRGQKLWARMYAEMLRRGRELTNETFEEWVLGFDRMAAGGGAQNTSPMTV